MAKKKLDTDITAQQLRAAAKAAWKLDAFLQQCNQDGVVNLMAFDLDFLANQFWQAAERLDPDFGYGGDNWDRSVSL